MSLASRGLAHRVGLESLLVKTGLTGLLAEPRRGPQAGKSGDPRSQNTDSKLLTHHQRGYGVDVEALRDRCPLRRSSGKGPKMGSHGYRRLRRWN